MTRIPEQGRLPVEDSLFDRLRAVQPDLQVMSVAKSTLVATSHLIETLVHDHSERCVLVSGFQHGRHWASERDRYLAMAGANDVIVPVVALNDIRWFRVNDGVIEPAFATWLNSPPAYIVEPTWWNA